MSRRTDVERGARLAHEIAMQWLVLLPLFPGAERDALELEMTRAAMAANRTIAECEWSRQVVQG